MPDVGVLPAPPADARSSQKPLRIALLSYRSAPKVGGQGIFVRASAAALARLGHRVEIISGPPYPDPVPGVRIVRLPSLDLYAQPHHGHRALRPRHLASLADTGEYLSHLTGGFAEPWSFGRRAAAYLRTRSGEFDIVLDNQTLAPGLRAIERAGLPVVGIVHHPIRRDRDLALAAEPRRRMRLLIRRWYGFVPMQERAARRLRRIVTVSRASAIDISAQMGVRTDRISVAHPGVDRAVFHARKIPRASARLVTTASADVPLKGLHVLLRAYAELLVRHPALELVVVGRLRPGATMDALDALALRGRVRFEDGLSDEALAELFASATICVTPSLYEGFGLPALEAMACGAPVVVTDGGALPEVVGDAGVVVPAGDAAALAAAIAALLDDPERLRSSGKASLARARHFSWDRFAAECTSILAEACRSC